MTPSVPRDIHLFLEGYPGEEVDSTLNANLEFYTNRQECAPDNLKLSQIHERSTLCEYIICNDFDNFQYRWAGDYRTLERNHGFIQWL